MSDSHTETSDLDPDQVAQEFEIPDRPLPASPPMGMFGSTSQSGYGSSRGERRGGNSRDKIDPKSLEDLYSAYPDLGHGDWKLRVERTQPRSFHGYSTAGYLGEFYERIALEEFKERFGGGRYRVRVMKPVNESDNATRSDYRVIKEIAFAIPGDPTLEGIPTKKDEDDMANKVLYPGGGRVSEAVEIKRLDLDGKRSEMERQERLEAQRRLDEERRRAQEVPAHMQNLFQETTQRVFDDLKDQSQAQLSFWQREVERLRADKNVMQGEIDKIRRELSEAQTQAANTNRQIETASMREQKERYEERITELKDRYDEERRRRDEEYSRKLGEMAEDHRKTVDDLTRRHDEERRSYEATQAMERERVREDSRTRIDIVERQKEQEITNLRQTYESRISDLRQSFENQINAMRDQTQREIESIRQSEGNSTRLSHESANLKIAVMEGEMTRLREENARMSAEVADLRDRNVQQVLSQVKDPIEEIERSKQMARYAGMVDAGDVPTGSGPRDWKEMGMTVAEKLFDNIPDIVNQVSKSRQQMAAAQQQQRVVVTPRGQQMHPQQMAAAQQQQLQAPQQQRFQPPPMAAQPMPPHRAPQQPHPQQQPMQGYGGMPQQAAYGQRGAPGADFTPPPMGTGQPMDSDSAVPLSSPYVQMASPVQPGGDSAESGANPLGSGDSDDDGQAGAVDVGPATFDGGGEQSQPAGGGEVQAPPQVQGSQAGEFFKELEMAIREGLISPALFARGFVERVGPQQAMQLVQQFSPEVIIDMAGKAASESRIVTRQGQKYVRELYMHVGQLLQQPAA